MKIKRGHRLISFAFLKKCLLFNSVSLVVLVTWHMFVLSEVRNFHGIENGISAKTYRERLKFVVLNNVTKCGACSNSTTTLKTVTRPNKEYKNSALPNLTSRSLPFPTEDITKTIIKNNLSFLHTSLSPMPKLFRCVPYFYIIGPEKCGTTDLYAHLLRHPQIERGMKKEPHYWTHYRPRGVSLSVYAELYDETAVRIERELLLRDKQTVIGDGSVSTIWDNGLWHRNSSSQPVVPQQIHQLTPGAKIILILRDPVKRLASDFLFHGHTSMNIFNQKITEGLQLLDACFHEHGRKHCVYSQKGTAGKNWDAPGRLCLGLYVEYIEDWTAVFPRNQIHIIILEEYAKKRSERLKRVAAFLGLDAFDGNLTTSLDKQRPVNAQAPHRYAQFGTLDQTIQRKLNKFYKPFNDRLAEMMGKELPW